MKHSKSRFSALFSIMIGSVSLFNTLVPSASYAAESNNSPQTFAILGAIGSLAYSCYAGKAPCVARNHIDLDELTFSLDRGKDVSLTNTRLAIGADWDEKVYESENWEIVGRWDLSFHRWTSDSDKAGVETTSGSIIGLSPVFHYQMRNMAYTPFIEMGGGPHLLNDIMIEDENKSTQFQFGSIFGLGIKKDGFEAGYRYLHISNASIKMPNPGTDIHSLHLGYHF